MPEKIHKQGNYALQKKEKKGDYSSLCDLLQLSSARCDARNIVSKQCSPNKNVKGEQVKEKLISNVIE